MAAISGDHQQPPHFALLPSVGMGHLTPFTRLAANLSLRNCNISFITPESTVSQTESLHISNFLTSFPSIKSFHLPVVELHPSECPSTDDPFFRHMEAIRRSAPALSSLLPSLSSPVSALIVDIFSASAFTPIANQLNIPCYILFTSSASVLSLVSYFPTYISTRPDSNSITDIDIPNLHTLPKSSIPALLHDPTNLFTIHLISNSQILSGGSVDGILLNTFHVLEAEAITALNSGKVVSTLAPVFAIGPLCDPLVEKNSKSISSVVAWLDQQPQNSVVYVSFGSRTAMTSEQIKELGVGLERSGKRFLWVIKTKKVDKDEEEATNLEEIIGEGYEERVNDRGMIVKGWVEQREILSHESVGGFVSHCGWNSVTEAAMSGVRVLGWPRIGDQRVNGEVVRRSGLGVWMEEWKWESEEGVVSGDEIGKRVKEMMEDEGLEESAKRVAEEARKAVGEGGSSEKGLEELIRKFVATN